MAEKIKYGVGPWHYKLGFLIFQFIGNCISVNRKLGAGYLEQVSVARDRGIRKDGFLAYCVYCVYWVPQCQKEKTFLQNCSSDILQLSSRRDLLFCQIGWAQLGTQCCSDRASFLASRQRRINFLFRIQQLNRVMGPGSKDCNQGRLVSTESFLSPILTIVSASPHSSSLLLILARDPGTLLP